MYEMNEEKVFLLHIRSNLTFVLRLNIASFEMPIAFVMYFDLVSYISEFLFSHIACGILHSSHEASSNFLFIYLLSHAHIL